MKYRPFSGTRVIMALILREVATTYGRSPGGYLWVILEPVVGVGLMTLLFSYALDSPPLGSNFALFYASGYLPFAMYSALTSKIASAIRTSRQLLAYPSVTYFDAILSRFLLGFIMQLLIFMILILGITLAFGLDLDVDALRLLNAFGMIAVVSFGVGTVNCYLFGTFTVWEQVWSILNRPLFLISGLFFLVDPMPEVARDLLLWNPIVHFITEIRAGLYPYYEGRYVSSLYVYAVGAVSTFLGLLLLYRHHRFLINEGA